MKTMKSTKRSLLISALSLFLCIGMLAGTTFAWFTDSVSSKNNIITSGNLDVELEYKQVVNGEFPNDWATVSGKEDIFDPDANWEPGRVEVVYLKVSNLGSLALKYQLGVNVVKDKPGTNVYGESFKLSDYLVFKTVLLANENAVGAYNTREAAVTAAGNKVGFKDYVGNTTALEVGGAHYVALIVYMPESVDNKANHNGTDIPSIEFGINLFATQQAAEEDSFGPDYDYGAPIVSAPVARPTTPVTLKGDKDVMVKLTQELIDELPAGVTEIGMSVSEPKVEGDKITFDSIELVDQNGDVIDLDALDLTEKITVTLPAQTTFAAGETVMIYHDGEFVATAVVDANGVISYDVEHLCEVTVGAVEIPVAKEDGVVEIGTAAQLFGFAQDVNAGNYYEGKTVVLTADIDLKDAEWTPIGSMTMAHGFMGNFDGNGKTISNLCIKNIALDADNYAYAGLFGLTEGAAGAENYVKNLAIENVTIDTNGHIVAAAIAYAYYTTVENITVCGDIAIKGGNYTSGVLAYTRRCTTASNLTVNGNEGSYITGGTTVGGVISDIQMNGGLTANYSNFKAANVTVTGDKAVGGISGIIGGQTLTGATVENVKLVCSNAHVGIVAGSFDSKPVINNATYSNVTGATTIVGAPYGEESNGLVTINGVAHAGNTAVFMDQLATGTVNLACNIALTETVTIANGQNVVINLNGSTIMGTNSGTATHNDLFTVKGNLTVKNGTVTQTHIATNMAWNGCTNTFDVTAGGVLNLDGVTVENLGGTDMNFAIHMNNWGTATVNVTNSTLKATYVALRVFNSGYDMNNVTIKNSTLASTGNAAFWVHNYTAADFGSQEKADAQAKLLNFTFENVEFEAVMAAFRYGFTNAEYYTPEGKQVVRVSTADELVAALAAGKNVVLNNDITVAATDGGYNKAGIVVNQGQVVNGNGHTLTVTGANSTWDCAIYLTNGTVKNITVAGAMRGIFTAGQSSDLYMDNVTFKNVIYTFNSDDGNDDYTIYISNSTVNGWTSHSNVHKEVVYTNCAFGEGSGYAFCRPYGPTQFVGCSFAEGYKIDAIGAVTFENCTIGGVALTADNLATLVVSNAANATVK